MKIKMHGDPPPFVKEFIEFQRLMPRIQMGKIPENAAGQVAAESVPLNAFMAAFLNTIWDNQEGCLDSLSRGIEGQISDQDKMQLVWNTLAAFMESVSIEFGWKPTEAQA